MIYRFQIALGMPVIGDPAMTKRMRTLLAIAPGLLAISLLFVGVWSCFDRIGIISLSANTSLKLDKGVMSVRHIYSKESRLTATEWPGKPIPQRRINPQQPAFPWISYSSGHQLGLIQQSGSIIPANYSLLYFPVWLPAILLASPIFILLIRCRQERPADLTMRQAGLV